VRGCVRVWMCACVGVCVGGVCVRVVVCVRVCVVVCVWCVCVCVGVGCVGVCVCVWVCVCVSIKLLKLPNFAAVGVNITSGAVLFEFLHSLTIYSYITRVIFRCAVDISQK